jgi:hypothetical protein
MTIRKMINTKTGMVSVFDQLVLNERDWYKEYIEEPEEVVTEEAQEKRKSTKQLLQEKAQELAELDKQ